MRLSTRLESLKLDFPEAVEVLRPEPSSLCLDRLFDDDSSRSPSEVHPAVIVGVADAPLLDLASRFPRLAVLELSSTSSTLLDSDFPFLPRTLTSLTMAPKDAACHYAMCDLPRGLTSLSLMLSSTCVWQQENVLGLPPALLSLEFNANHPLRSPLLVSLLPRSLTHFSPLMTNATDDTVRQLPDGLLQITLRWRDDHLTPACLNHLPPHLTELSVAMQRTWHFAGRHLRSLPATLKVLCVYSAEWAFIEPEDWPKNLKRLEIREMTASGEEEWKKIPRSLEKLYLRGFPRHIPPPTPASFSHLPDSLALLSIAYNGSIDDPAVGHINFPPLTTLIVILCHIPPEVVNLLPPSLTLLRIEVTPNWNDETIKKLPNKLTSLSLISRCSITSACFQYLPTTITSLIIPISQNIQAEHVRHLTQRNIERLILAEAPPFASAEAVQALPQSLNELEAAIPGKYFIYLPRNLRSLRIVTQFVTIQSEHIADLPRRLLEIYFSKTHASASAYKDIPIGATLGVARGNDALYQKWISERSKRINNTILRPDPRFR